MKLTATLTAFMLSTTAANACVDQTFFAGANLTAFHIDTTREFNRENYGAFVGYHCGVDFQYGVELGFYDNSHGNITRYGLVYWDYPIAQINDVTIRAGTFGGLFEYPELVKYHDNNGLYRIDDFVFIPGLQITTQYEQHGLKLKITPGANTAKYIIGVQYSYEF